MFDFDGDPPSQKALKRYFIDRNIAYFPQDILAHVAYMILAIDNVDEIAQLALNLIVNELSACRADMGFLCPDDMHYKPHILVLNKHGTAPNCDGESYCNQDTIFQKTWRQPSPVFCSNIAEDVMVADSRESFTNIGSESILFQRLSVADDLIGLICIDFTNERHCWQPTETHFIQRFTDTFLSPLILINQTWYRGDAINMKKPTLAELDAIRLAAKGLSYKQIAFSLNKSIRTIENQLRHARESVGAMNQVDLITKCERWLDNSR